MNQYRTLLVESPVNGPVICQFNLPETRNALSREMVNEIRDLLNTLAIRDEIPTIIFTGSDKSFISGADISELLERRKEDALKKINATLFDEIEAFPSPTIAAVRGWALGGGCELAMACDIRVVGNSARIGQPEVSLGIIPAAGGCFRLPKLIGIGKAREMIYTGRLVDAAEAADLGWANRLVDDTEVISTSTKIAEQIMANSNIAVSHAKSLISEALLLDNQAAMDREAQSQAVLFEHPDKMQRMTAFLERKRGNKTPK